MEEKLDFLIKYLQNDIGEEFEEMPVTLEEKERVWRALCNIRKPRPISDEYLKVQDEYLQERLKTLNIADAEEIKTVSEIYKNKDIENGDKIAVWQGDITKLKVDCIVNAANSGGIGCFQPMHNCIDNQVQTYSGIQMRLECSENMKKTEFKDGIPTGEAFVTEGYNLPVKKVIHTVGPSISFNVTDEDKGLLENCYKNSLKLAVKENLKTIAFPCISTGIFRFPRRLAVECAIKAVNEFLDENNSIEKVIFNVFSDENYEIYEDYFTEN